MGRKFYACAVFTILTLVALSSATWQGAGAQGGAQLPTLTLTSPVGGFTLPVGVIHAGDRSGRLFVIEQNGLISIVKDGARLSTPFLDITSRTSKGGERGLLGLAFPPDYATKGYFYVNYTNTAGDTVIARYSRNATNPDLADFSSEQVVALIPQPFSNHNGGHMAFGPRDGYLYVATGDGGSGGDPGNRAQNPAQLLGKLLRIDVETGRPYTYTVPQSNPFVGAEGYRPEIWALGLRNPWRFSFDRVTGDLFVGDVGQSEWEEIDFQPGDSEGGENYGWRIMEGQQCFNPVPCDQTGLTLPVWSYSHSGGDCSVTGGFVYRGTTYPRMQGLYFYADYCTARFWALRRVDGAWQSTELLNAPGNISSFGEDEAGELYVAVHNTGQILRLADAGPALPPSATPTPATVKFTQAAYNVNEEAHSATVTLRRDGDTSVELRVDYATSDGTASEKSDYTTARGTVRFAPGEVEKSFTVVLTDDERSEPAQESVNLTLSNLRSSGSLAAPTTVQLLISDADTQTSPPNPIDDSEFFVRQHYADFLNRVPDEGGLAF
ncbi:MAG TPA: PQQ-dependent sugar dehydrogenase, partial [Pyrinomonadaceae bacterium]|nr:PQQ-dependent sugar dehydrogenase [Pyrinomonadaceae bacterium]